MSREAETTFFETPKDDPRDRIDVEIGDSKQTEFLPQLKVSRWKNEANLAMRLIHDETAPVVTETQRGVVWSGVNRKAEFYQLPASDILREGGFEFDITRFRKPRNTNVTARFSLNTKDVAFHYQPELTAKEIAMGASRPENVVGSFAIYAATPKMNVEGGMLYRNAKLGHLYRPWIMDSADHGVWGEQSIENGQLIIRAPQEFLDTCVYPIRHAAGATVGYTAAGASEGYNFPNAGIGAVGTPASPGTVTKISYYTRYQFVSTNLKPVIWEGITSGAVIADGVGPAITVSNTTPAWLDLPYSIEPSVVVDDYVFGVVHAAGNTSLYYDIDPGGTGVADGTNSYATPQTFDDEIGGGLNISCYATYTPIATGGGQLTRGRLVDYSGLTSPRLVN